jgi:hypothetical protein
MLTSFSSYGHYSKSLKNSKKWDILGITGTGEIIERIVVDSNGIIYASGTGLANIFNVHSNTSRVSNLRCLARYNPVTLTWSSIITGIMQGGFIRSLALDSNNNLYVAGYFKTLSGKTVNHIAKWDPIASTWSALNHLDSTTYIGVSEAITSVTCDSQNNVYVCGSFSHVGYNINAIGQNGVDVANGVAKYTVSTNTWSVFGSGITGTNVNPIDICVDTNYKVYIAGLLYSYGHLACWDGSNWGTLGGGTGLNQETQSVTTDSNNNVYVCGGFDSVNSSFDSANNVSVPKGIAMWNGTVWSDLGASDADEEFIIANPRAIKIADDNKLYIGTTYRHKVHVYDG